MGENHEVCDDSINITFLLYIEHNFICFVSIELNSMIFVLKKIKAQSLLSIKLKVLVVKKTQLH